MMRRSSHIGESMGLFLLATAVYSAKEEDSNELSRPPINLDANLRRALLKALTELENEENAKEKQNSNSKIIEKASASSVSFYANGNLITQSTEKLTTTSTTTEKAPPPKQIIVVQKSKGLQHKPLVSIENYQNLENYNEAEQILTSATNSFSSPDKFSYKSNQQQPNQNLLVDDFKTTQKPLSLNRKIEVTTPTTTTTSTEESEAKVEDVQFFSAPLVAAFTVHQDERGLPKSVEPIYKPVTQLLQNNRLSQNRKQQQEFNKQKILKQEEELQVQLALQDKQKSLEEEILRLKQQQQHQNYLIRQQQSLHEQQLQIQKDKLLQEQARIRTNQQPFVPLVNSNFNFNHGQNSFGGSNNNSRTKGNSLVTLQPSVTLDSSLPLNGQQLPVRNAIDFRSPLITVQAYQPFNFLRQQQQQQQQQHQQQQNLQLLQPGLISNNVQLPQQSLLPPHNRVFRHESDTGNFYTSLNQLPLQQQNNRFFRSNLESTFTSPYNFQFIQPPVVNHHLNNLLYNSGFIRGGKQQEDLNIVSKVLSLNHYGGDNRFASSRINEQRILAPSLIKKV